MTSYYKCFTASLTSLFLVTTGLTVFSVPATASTEDAFEFTDLPAETYELALSQTLTGGNLSISGLKINGQSVGNSNFDQVRRTVARFSNGTSSIGLDSGLVMGAEFFPADVSDTANLRATPSSNFADGEFYDVPDVETDPEAVDSPEAALYRSAEASDLEDSVESISKIEFSAVPTGNYLKLSFVMTSTEAAGDLEEYPDGLGIFSKKSSEELWDFNNNCASIPTTNQFLTLFSAGTVAEGPLEEVQATAKNNYDTLVEGWRLGDAPRSNSELPLGWNSSSIAATTPITCLIDVSAANSAQESIDVAFVLANLGDGSVPPYAFFAESSFSFDDVPGLESLDSEPEPEPEQISPPQFSAPSPFQGPLITDVGADNTVASLQAAIGNDVRVLGHNLSGVSSVMINGIEAELVSVSENSFVFTVPEGLESGTYDLTVVSGGQNVQVQEQIVITSNNASCVGQEPNLWTQKISDTQAKVYIKCGTPSVSYRIDVQQNGGDYETLITRTLVDENDDRQVFNSVGRYIVRTIDLESKTRIRIFAGDEKQWQVVYNQR